MPTLDDPARLLDLLQEAGEEPVSLDELEIVGVSDPARALLSLELAGFPVHRVHDRRSDGPVTCVRLGAGAPAPAPSPASAPTAPRAPGAGRAPLLVAVVALLLVLLVARRA
jgi:hypothetical protein